MARILISLMFLILPWSSELNAQSILKKGFYVACGDSKLLIIDPLKSSPEHTEIVWEWDAQTASDIPEEYKNRLISLDECKPVLDNRKILVCSSSGATLLIDVESKAVEFYAKTPMAHSAAMLPNDRIVVVNSTHKDGNNLELYEIGKSETRLFTDTLYSGHGAVWDEPSKRLYILGYNRLKKYSLENWNREKPSLKLENFWLLPGKSGHDLTKGKDGSLLITTHHHVYNFDLASGKFKEFIPLKGKKNVKSINYTAQDDNIVYTIAEESWWTENIYQTNSKKSISLPGLRLYKVRVAE